MYTLYTLHMSTEIVGINNVVCRFLSCTICKLDVLIQFICCSLRTKYMYAHVLGEGLGSEAKCIHCTLRANQHTHVR